MKGIIYLLVFTAFLISCKTVKKSSLNEEIKTESYLTENYEIIKPINNTKVVLFLFPGFGEDIERTKKEFDIIEIARKNKIALVFMNYSDKLWLEDEDKIILGKVFQNVLEKYHLDNVHIFIGGHSAGGTISLLISNFLKDNRQFDIDPNGVFITDSPLDLLSLYRRCKDKIAKNSEDALSEECRYIVNYFNEEIGNPENGISLYEKYSVYTLESMNIENLSLLKSTKMRLYTEPDIEWWKTNYGMEYKETNAYQIKKLSEILIDNNYKKVEYIATENMGFRSNGERNPHSWSIIDKEDLIDWILKK